MSKHFIFGTGFNDRCSICHNRPGLTQESKAFIQENPNNLKYCSQKCFDIEQERYEREHPDGCLQYMFKMIFLGVIVLSSIIYLLV